LAIALLDQQVKNPVKFVFQDEAKAKMSVD